MDRTYPAAEELVQHLVESISAKIFNGVYAPGQKLRQETLAEEYDVSRTPVREAFRQLETKGLIVQQPRYGATVVAPTIKDIGANYWLRGELEGMAAELAARWISDADLQRLQATHTECAQAVGALYAEVNAGNGATPRQAAAPMQHWVIKNQEFHALIFRAAGNASLERIIKDLHTDYTKNILNMTVLGMYEARMKKNIEHHAAIVQALTARDADASRAAMRSHIHESGEFVVDWLQKRPEGRKRPR
ncbi:bacterial regulatory protein, GntR family protein 65 [Achromobacter xylosoxidans A8]|uniref:Bacterial regulatory protein, GntR family protein 65 n=1 Tax=Achromobacter xylosoxidans (strain A8) TaxID=762376 RepID=E3HHB7_ACHXA|nr:GntR family transcriptional regulator [Achromobacter xylosoxidans]ADP19067.1 bacterial regulatory protein, GntR family protein 65 [Achromobacter xylosoxidans A8]